MTPTVDDLVARGMERKCCVQTALGLRHPIYCTGFLVPFLLLRGIEERFPHGAINTREFGWIPAPRNSEPHVPAQDYRSLSDLLADPRAWGIACEKHAAMVEGEPCRWCQLAPRKRYVTCSPPEAADFHDDDGQGYIFETAGGEAASGREVGDCVFCNGTGHTEPALVLPVESWPLARETNKPLRGTVRGAHYAGTVRTRPALEYAGELRLEV